MSSSHGYNCIWLYYNNDSDRRNTFVSGYRPIFNFEKEGISISGRVDLIEKAEFAPGEEGKVHLSFISELLRTNLEKGLKFTFGEGEAILGEGVIIEILSKD